jgi:hypothetical protein
MSNKLDFKFDSDIGPSRKQRFFSENDDFEYLRQHSYDFAKEICAYLKDNPSSKVLEVGPSSGLYCEHAFPQYDTAIIAQACKENSIYYKTLDIDTSAKTDFIGNVEDLSFIKEKFDVIIMLEIIEHVENIFVLSQSLNDATNSKARVFINSPYMFKVHGPIPDCWRISEYGYRFLFKEHFNVETINPFPPNELGKNTMPLSINVVLNKK